MPYVKNPGIYTITNIKTGKMYVGSSTKSVYERMRGHLRDLRENKHPNSLLQNAWNIYKEESFKFELLIDCLPEHCLGVEQYWINMLNSCNRNFGYNLAPVTINSYGQKRTKRQCLNISNSVKGKREGIKNHRYGTTWSDETRDRVIKGLTTKKGVCKCDLDGNVIEVYISINSAGKALNKSTSPIIKCCKNRKKYNTAYGYKWKYNTLENE